MADPKEIAKQFANFYYSIFDGDRQNLVSLYRDNSMLSWESKEFVGVVNIIEHLKGLPFQKIVHNISTLDVQPSNITPGSMVVMITGLLKVDEEPNLIPFTQVFHLIQDGTSYFVFNDIFRLNVG